MITLKPVRQGLCAGAQSSHCKYFYVDMTCARGQQGKVRLNTIRANTKYTELIETKRVYKHPLYKYKEAYNDVSLIELGRRIAYDYDNFGDTPTCVDLGIARDRKQQKTFKNS